MHRLVSGLMCGAWLLAAGCGRPHSTMLFHAGVGLRSSLNDIKAQFEQRHAGVRINYSYKGSGFCLADVVRSREGDLFMPGEEFYVLQAVERGCVAEYDRKTDIPAYFMVVIITPEGNPKNIQKVEDFARPGVRVSLGNEKACAIGVWHKRIFTKAGIWEAVKNNEVHSAKCIPEIGNAIQHRLADASIVWASTAVLYLRDLEIVPLQPDYRGLVRLPVAILKSAKHPDLARKLKRFMFTDEAKAIFRSHGYVTDPGPIDEDGFCLDGGKATQQDCHWLVEAARVCKDESLPVNAQTCGHLVEEVRRQRKTKRAGVE